MKLYILKLLLVMVAIMAFDPGAVEASENFHDYHFSRIPQLDIEPIKNPSVRDVTNQINYIAEPFFPIVILAHSLYEERDFSFYLPVYLLHRQKEFFLVI